MKIALVQTNSQIGHIAKNQENILNLSLKAHQQGASLVLFPSFSLTGLPLLKGFSLPHLQQDMNLALKILKEKLPPNLGVFLGSYSKNFKEEIVFFYQGEMQVFQAKNSQSWQKSPHIYPHILHFQDKKIALAFGNPKKRFDFKKGLPSIDLFVHFSASFFVQQDLDSYGQGVKEQEPPFSVFFINGVGGNDKNICYGRSFSYVAQTKQLVFNKAFQEDFNLILLNEKSPILPSQKTKKSSFIKNLKDALICGIQDYFYKTGFKKAVLGLSGGLDSALVLVLAAKALQKENVVGLLMPGPFSTPHSVSDALALAKNLQVPTYSLPIQPAYDVFLQTLNPIFDTKSFGLTHENLQARIRGILVMAYSNQKEALALNTSNKSEFLMGYTTLYGDMAGALSPLGDIYKTQVYELCYEINKDKEMIPAHIISKPPSAELRPNQIDAHSLPPYPELDLVLKLYTEKGLNNQEIASKTKFSLEKVQKITRAVWLSQYKRSQAPLILQVSSLNLFSQNKVPLSAFLNKV